MHVNGLHTKQTIQLPIYIHAKTIKYDKWVMDIKLILERKIWKHLIYLHIKIVHRIINAYLVSAQTMNDNQLAKLTEHFE